METEIWKDAVGLEDRYRVSSLGRVISLSRGRNLILAQSIVKGYFVVRPYFSSYFAKMIYVHKIVALAFIGPKPSNAYQVNHKNGNRIDNRARNLEWSTHTANMRHAQTLPWANQGERCYLAKLTERKVRAIRMQITQGIPARKLAAHYGVEKTTIYDIMYGRSWKWLK